MNYKDTVEKLNYSRIKDFIYNTLITASTPYTELISTQVLGFSALCDAVNAYNHAMRKSGHSPLLIHQYITEWPSKGAIDYFHGLRALRPEQLKTIKLYACGLSKDLLEDLLPDYVYLKGVFTIHPKDNPMIRSGFMNEKTSLHDQWDRDNVLRYLLDNQTSGQVTVKKGERIASIVLGSQASRDTIEYIKILLGSSYSKLFVFSGFNASIKEQLKKTGHDDKRVILLDYQPDETIQPIMTRSNLIILRGGGLSVMEQMAMDHHPQQAFLIHHGEFTRTIPWEEGNVDALTRFLGEKGIYVKKTTVSQARKDIEEVNRISR